MEDWKRQAEELYFSRHMSLTDITTALGRTYNSVRGFIRNHPDYRSGVTLREEQQARKAEPESPDDIDGKITKEKIRLEKSEETTQIKELIKDRAQRDIIAEKMCAAIRRVDALPITPISMPNKTHFRDEELVLMISDIQAGTFVSSEATGGLNHYDKYILRDQMELLKNTMVSIVSRYKSMTNVKKLNIFFLGDMIEGIDIFVGQAQQVDQDLWDQMFELAELLAWFLQEMLYLFDTVSCHCIGGNHGRVGKKGENPHHVNFDRYLYMYLAQRLQNYHNITWDIPKSWWALVDVQGWNFLLLHGDDINSWNSIPYYGIERADARWTLLLDSINKRYDYMTLGHFHTASELSRVKGKKIINGCWPGGSMLALKGMVTSSQPSQILFAVHPEHGKTATWEIGLEVDK